MKVKRIVSILLSGVAASVAVAFPIYAQSDSEINREKIYECQKIGGNYVTMMNVNNQSYRLIEWESDPDPDRLEDYPPTDPEQLEDYPPTANSHRLIPNPNYGDPYYPENNSEQLRPIPDEDNFIKAQERCQSVSLRLDTINYNYSLNSSSEIPLLAGRISMNLQDAQGNVLRNSQGLPFQINPWVICAVSQMGETCNRENMLFTIDVNNAMEANQFLGNFINLINNPGEFQAIQL